MSSSVWYDEVDRGLVALVKKVLGKDITVAFSPNRKETLQDPKQPYKRPKYPYVRIVHITDKFDRKRYNKDTVVVDVDKDTSQATVGVSAKPYILTYQFEIVTDKLSDLNRLTRLWNFSVLDKHNLDVVDSGGTPRTCYMSRTIATEIIDSDQKDDQVFRNIQKYKIRVEIDEDITYKVPMATKISFSTSAK